MSVIGLACLFPLAFSRSQLFWVVIVLYSNLVALTRLLKLVSLFKDSCAATMASEELAKTDNGPAEATETKVCA